MKRFLSLLLMIVLLVSIAPAQNASAAVRINKSKITLNEGNKYALEVYGTTKTVKWSTSNKSIVTVSSSGKIKAIKVGKATITASVSSKKYKCIVTVKDVLTNEEAAAKITYEAYELNDSLLLILDNGNKVNLSANINVVYYDSNGNVLSKEIGYIWTFQAGKNAVETFSYPHDDSYGKVKYDKYEVTVTTELDSFMTGTSQIDNLVVESNKGSSYLIATITNNSDEDLNSADVTVLYYKDGQLIGYDNGYLFGLGAGKSDIIELREPYDENYDKIEYDDYKIVINEAY